MYVAQLIKNKQAISTLVVLLCVVILLPIITNASQFRLIQADAKIQSGTQSTSNQADVNEVNEQYSAQKDVRMGNVFNYSEAVNDVTIDDSPTTIIEPSQQRIMQYSDTSIIITNLKIDKITDSSAQVSIITDKPAGVYIRYGIKGTEFIEDLVSKNGITTNHQTSMLGLYPGVEYTVQIIVEDKYERENDYRELSFKTLPLASEPFVVIDNSLYNNTAAALTAFTGGKSENYIMSNGNVKIVKSIKDDTPTPILDKEQYEKHRKERSIGHIKYSNGLPLNKTPAVKMLNIVALLKDFDVKVLSELYSQATTKQRKMMHIIEPALFTKRGTVNGGVFKVLSSTKRAHIARVLDSIDGVSIYNDSVSIKTKFNSKLTSASMQWSAYDSTVLEFSVDDLLFVKPVKSLSLRLGSEMHKAMYMSDGSWHASIEVPAVIGAHDLDVYVEYTDKTFDLHKTKLQVVSLPQIVGKRSNAANVSGGYTRIGSSEVTIYKGVYDANTQATVWKLYKEQAKKTDNLIQFKNPQITNQNGEFAAVLPAGKYRFSVVADGYKDVSNTIVNHGGGVLSATVLLSESTLVTALVDAMPYAAVLVVILLAMFGIVRLVHKYPELLQFKLLQSFRNRKSPKAKTQSNKYLAKLEDSSPKQKKRKRNRKRHHNKKRNK